MSSIEDQVAGFCGANPKPCLYNYPPIKPTSQQRKNPGLVELVYVKIKNKGFVQFDDELGVSFSLEEAVDFCRQEGLSLVTTKLGYVDVDYDSTTPALFTSKIITDQEHSDACTKEYQKALVKYEEELDLYQAVKAQHDLALAEYSAKAMVALEPLAKAAAVLLADYLTQKGCSGVSTWAEWLPCSRIWRLRVSFSNPNNCGRLPRKSRGWHGFSVKMANILPKQE